MLAGLGAQGMAGWFEDEKMEEGKEILVEVLDELLNDMRGTLEKEKVKVGELV